MKNICNAKSNSKALRENAGTEISYVKWGKKNSQGGEINSHHRKMQMSERQRIRRNIHSGLDKQTFQVGLTAGYDSSRTEVNYVPVSLEDGSIFELEDHFMIIMYKVHNVQSTPREVTLNNSFHMTLCVCTKYVTMR